MFTIPVTYPGIEDGEEIKEVLHFHMSTKDWLKADADTKHLGGYEKFIESKMSDGPENPDPVDVLTLLEDVVRRSYGVRSEDGRKFIRSEELTEEFMSSMAYDAFLDTMLFDPGVSQAFMRAILPKNVDLAKLEEAAK